MASERPTGMTAHDGCLLVKLSSMTGLRMEFGFLQIPLEGSFSGVDITPLPDHKDRLAWLNQHSNKDGFFYPPQVCTYETDLVTHKPRKKVEKTNRPASVYHLPASHQLLIDAPISPLGNSFADDALIIYLLAFVYGTRFTSRSGASRVASR